MNNDYYIIVEGEENLKHKIAKIIFTKEGGFSLIPSHPDTNGLVAKNIVEYNYTGMKIYPFTSKDPIYNVSSNVKLTIHYDGFTQFSSVNQDKKIVSGKMKYSGLAKGVGISIPSLKNPIKTGPTCNIAVWGLEKYKIENNTKKNNMIFFPDSSLIFENCNQNTWKGSYCFNIFLFEKSFYEKYLDEEHGKLFLVNIAKNYLPKPNSLMKFRIINNKKVDYLIGIIGMKILTDFKFESGYSISGPSDLIPPNFYPEKKGIIINAIFPSPFYDNPEFKKLDYIPEFKKEDFEK